MVEKTHWSVLVHIWTWSSGELGFPAWWTPGQWCRLTGKVLGCTNLITHEIPLLDNTPIRQRYRRIPPSEYEMAKEHINQLLGAQVIRESCSPFASPIVLVKKKDGSLRLFLSGWRLCCSVCSMKA